MINIIFQSDDSIFFFVDFILQTYYHHQIYRSTLLTKNPVSADNDFELQQW